MLDPVWAQWRRSHPCSFGTRTVVRVSCWTRVHTVLYDWGRTTNSFGKYSSSTLIYLYVFNVNMDWFETGSGTVHQILWLLPCLCTSYCTWISKRNERRDDHGLLKQRGITSQATSQQSLVILRSGTPLLLLHWIVGSNDREQSPIMATKKTTTPLSSEGFDLDAASHELDVLELGGGITREAPPPATPPTEEQQETPQDDNPLKEAEAFKAQGNAHFKGNQYELAVESYTSAILATPGHPTGEELLRLRDEWQINQDKAWREKLAQADQARRDEALKRREKKRDSSQKSNQGSSVEAEEDDDDKDNSSPSSHQRPKEVFQPPSHPHGATLAVYYCNRAAAYLHLHQSEEAAHDCDIALLLNPHYLKALGRRATAHENLGKTDAALSDVQSALALDATNRELRQRRDRLQKLEDERLEKLKAETFDKLKDLGNSILGNFGLSMDNFKAEKDPNTGSYSISFQQNN